VEDWVREHWMPANLEQAFYRRHVGLSSGGVFDFGAVSGDGSIAATISTSGARTARARNAAGKLYKIRSAMHFLLLAQVSRRLVILTEADMFELCHQERANGRIPDSIEFAVAELPEHLATKLKQARASASREVSPNDRVA
jgi:hypothetical protein